MQGEVIRETVPEGVTLESEEALAKQRIRKVFQVRRTASTKVQEACDRLQQSRRLSLL